MSNHKKSASYTPLAGDPESLSPLLSKPQYYRHHKRPYQRRFWILQAILFIINLTIAIFLFGTNLNFNPSHSRPDSSSPLASTLGREEFENVIWVGNFVENSGFRGKPSEAMVKRWDEVADNPRVRLREEDLDLLVRRDSLVRTEDGGVVATIAGGHMLHCVKMLWQHTYIQYFPELMVRAKGNCKAYHAHLDHCADILRQQIQCWGDTNVVTYNWVKGMDTPWPSFDVMRTCRKMERVKSWEKANAVNLDGRLKKPHGVAQEEFF